MNFVGLYQDSQKGECPLMVDKEKPSCGNSRFGCWACTVVQEDKSLKGFIQTAHKRKDNETVQKLQPLAELRNWLKENRNLEEYRETKDRMEVFIKLKLMKVQSWLWVI